MIQYFTIVPYYVKVDHNLTFVSSMTLPKHVASQRKTKNKGISILLLVETNLAFSKSIQNLDADFLHRLLKKKNRKLAYTCNSSFCFKVDVLSQTILEPVMNYIASIYISLNLKIPLKLKSVLLTLTFTLKSTTEEDKKKQTSTTNTMTSLFQYHSDVLDISQLLTQKATQTRLRCSQVEVIALTILRPLSQSG